jgi:multidrug efflux pump subunit AcrA (membrane-fusion protein)
MFARKEGKMLHTRSVKAALTALLAISTLLLAGCGFRKETAEASGASPGSDANPIVVSGSAAESRQVPLFADATGSFVAEESSDVAPLASGRVIQTPVDIGDRVEKGEIVARLDDSDALLRLQQAKASVEQADAALRQAQDKIGFTGGPFKPEAVPEVQSARASYDSAVADSKLADADASRYESLLKTGDISRSNYEKQATLAETARARVNTALRQYESALNNARQNYQAIASAQAMLSVSRAQLAQAQKALDDTIIRAPISGYVAARQVSVGEYVSPASKIITIVRSNPIKLQLQISAMDTSRLSLGLRVLARIEGYGNREFEGKVTALNPSLDPNSRSMTVESRFDNPKLELRPGMFATARVILPGTEQVVMVPRNAVLIDPTLDSAEVFVVQSGRARVRVVQVYDAEAATVRIRSGVSAGEVVATDRLQQLYDGAAVKLMGK